MGLGMKVVSLSWWLLFPFVGSCYEGSGPGPEVKAVMESDGK